MLTTSSVLQPTKATGKANKAKSPKKTIQKSTTDRVTRSRAKVDLS